MRTHSFFTIILLCLAILVVDIFAFYWLRSITSLLPSMVIRHGIHIAFWTFTVALITAILILKWRLDHISAQRRHLLVSSLYGLTVSSFIPKLIFVVVISILYFTNYAFEQGRAVLWVPLLGLAAGFLPFFVIAYAIFRSRYRFKVYHQTLRLSSLPACFDNLRIVHISDAHLGSFNARYHIFDRAVRIINHLKPDFIFFTGDLVNNYAWELADWHETFRGLKAKSGKYSVLGNHDYGDYSDWETHEDKERNFDDIKFFHEETGFRLLLNESVVIERDGGQVALLGVENWGHPPFKQYGDLQKTIQAVGHIPCKILLSHDPSHWSGEVIRETDIALTLAGHTHGMQAAINLKNKSWSPIKYKYPHWAGLYEENGQYLYVNRGLGWLGFPGRLGMRPEITLIELKTKDGN